MKIPAYINNFNRLGSLRNMVDRLRGLSEIDDITIIDNHSDYQPLLDWYARADVDVVMLGCNGGPYALWSEKIIDERDLTERGISFYIYSDSDMDLSRCPDDLVHRLSKGHQYPRKVKIGLSIEINDIPSFYPFRRQVLMNEQKYWRKIKPDGFIRSGVDTTFAMYKVGTKRPARTWPALRAGRPYVARHLPWYEDPKNLSDEDRHFYRSTQYGFWSMLMRDYLERGNLI